MPEGFQTVEDLGKLVKKKYPAYANLSDVELGQKVKAKYPAYSNFADMPVGAEKTGLPGLPKSNFSFPVQHTISGQAPGDKEQSFLSSPHGFLREGARDIQAGAESFAGGNKLEGATQMAGGALSVASPALIGMGGASVARAPIQTVLRGVLGLGTFEATKEASKKWLGANETVGNVLGVIAGGLVEHGLPSEDILRDIWRFRDNPGVAKAAFKFFTNLKSRVPGLGKAMNVENLEGLESAIKEAKGPSLPKPTPYPPGKGTGTKFTPGPEGEELQVGKNIPRGKFTPPPKEPEVTPYPKGKGTGTKFGGSYDPQSEASGPPPKGQVRRAPRTQEETTSEGGGGAELKEPPKGGKARTPEEWKKFDQQMSGNKRDYIVGQLQKIGVSKERWDALSRAEKVKLAKEMGYPGLSREMEEMVSKGLGGGGK